MSYMMAKAPDPDLTFTALAHPGRRRMLDLLVEHPGMTVNALASHFEFSRVATHKHLAVLEAASLVISERQGRTRRLFFNPIPIQQIHDRWTNTLAAFWAGRMADIQSRVEHAHEAREQRHA